MGVQFADAAVAAAAFGSQATLPTRDQAFLHPSNHWRIGQLVQGKERNVLLAFLTSCGKRDSRRVQRKGQRKMGYNTRSRQRDP